MLKIVVSLFVLFVWSCSYSQISVKNDNYLFVSDAFIFIEDDLNLNETNSRLFLRNGGQLLQGSGLTANSGVGELSVYQNGNVGAYEYNYWCSPIGQAINTNSNNPFGIPLLNDIVDVTTSIPVGFTNQQDYNGTANPLNVEPYWIWKFVASSNYSDWIHIQDNFNINPGEGFTMKGTEGISPNNLGNQQNYDFRGKQNNGTISTNVLNYQFTLVGNPYPSALDALAYIHDSENSSIINGTLYYWEQNPNTNSHNLATYDGGYATYTISADGSVETYIPAVFYTYNPNGTINTVGSGTPSGKDPRRYIPIAQGFMVEGQADGVVKTKNTHRVYQKELPTISEFFRNSQSTATTNSYFSDVPDDYKRFRLNVTFNNSHTRQLVETFHNSATDGFDYGLESKLTYPFTTDAFWITDNEAFTAEALPFNENLIIPLTLNIDQNTTIEINLIDIQNFEGQSIYLYDTLINNYTDLKIETFNTNLESGVNNSRFQIRFKQENSLPTEEFNFNNLEILHENSDQQLLVVNNNLLDISSIEIYDVSGKKIIERTINTKKQQYELSTSKLSIGVYIAKVKSNHTYIKAIKFIVGVN